MVGSPGKAISRASYGLHRIPSLPPRLLLLSFSTTYVTYFVPSYSALITLTLVCEFPSLLVFEKTEGKDRTGYHHGPPKDTLGRVATCLAF